MKDKITKSQNHKNPNLGSWKPKLKCKIPCSRFLTLGAHGGDDKHAYIYIIKI